MFRNELAKEIEKIERKIKELENKLDFVFSNSEPDDDGAMETVMLLSENIVFLKEKEKKLKETLAPDNAYTYAEYKRIEKIYNADNNPEKSDAYAMYQKPDGVIQELLLENQKLKSEITEQRFKIQDLEKEIEQLKKNKWKYKDLKNEAEELKKQIQRSYDDIMYHMFDKMGI